MTDGAVFIRTSNRSPLGKMGGVDFTVLKDAENDILDDFDWYHSWLLAERHAPDQGQLEKKLKDLASMIRKAMAAIKFFSDIDGGRTAKQEFHAAVNDLLREADWEPVQFKELLAETGLLTDRLATIARALLAVLADRLGREGSHVASSPAIRTEFFRRLHRTLGRHGLDTGVGVNSLIVELVLQKDGKVSDVADTIQRRRKDLAREVRLAVKPPKGG